MKTKGVLDNEFRRVPADDPNKVPTGYGHWCNSWPEDPAWRFVAVGVGHEVDYWTEVLTALREVDPDIVVNIEHEDAAMSVLDGLGMAARTLHEARQALTFDLASDLVDAYRPVLVPRGWRPRRPAPSSSASRRCRARPAAGGHLGERGELGPERRRRTGP